MTSLAIRNTKVFDGLGFLDGSYDVLVQEKTIEDVSPYSADRRFEGVKEISAEGCTLMPGLIDLHVHLTWNGGPDPANDIRRETFAEHMMTTVSSALSYLPKGITSVRDLGSPEDSCLHVENAILAGKFEGPRIFGSGQSIIMTGGHDPFHGIMADGPWEALKAVRTQAAKGAKVIKISATGGVYGREEGEGVDDVELRQEEVDIIVDEAHRRNLRVTAHAIGESGIRGCIDAGIDCIEHGHCITEKMAVEMHEKGIALVPTFYIYQHLSSTETVPGYAREKARQIIGRHRDALKWAHERGVLIGAGSDAGSPFGPHPLLLKEIIALTDGGLTNSEALTAATYNAAKILGIEDRLGSVKKGMLADLVLVCGDPFKELKILESPMLVLKDGKTVFSNGADLLLNRRNMNVVTI